METTIVKKQACEYLERLHYEERTRIEIASKAIIFNINSPDLFNDSLFQKYVDELVQAKISKEVSKLEVFSEAIGDLTNITDINLTFRTGVLTYSKDTRKLKEVRTIDIPEERVSEIEATQYEAEARSDISAYLISSRTDRSTSDSPLFKRLRDDLTDLNMKYDRLVDALLSDFIPDDVVGSNYEWTLNYRNNALTVKVL